MLSVNPYGPTYPTGEGGPSSDAVETAEQAIEAHKAEAGHDRLGIPRELGTARAAILGEEVLRIRDYHARDQAVVAAAPPGDVKEAAKVGLLRLVEALEDFPMTTHGAHFFGGGDQVGRMLDKFFRDPTPYATSNLYQYLRQYVRQLT